jgi:hypothetical protein
MEVVTNAGSGVREAIRGEPAVFSYPWPYRGLVAQMVDSVTKPRSSISSMLTMR